MEQHDCTVIGFNDCKVRISDSTNPSLVLHVSSSRHRFLSSVSTVTRPIRRISETTSVLYPDNSILVLSMIKSAPLCQHGLETSNTVIATPRL